MEMFSLGDKTIISYIWLFLTIYSKLFKFCMSYFETFKPLNIYTFIQCQGFF